MGNQPIAQADLPRAFEAYRSRQDRLFEFVSTGRDSLIFQGPATFTTLAIFKAAVSIGALKIDPATGQIAIGEKGQQARLSMLAADGSPSIELDGNKASVSIGGHKSLHGRLELRKDGGSPTISLNAVSAEANIGGDGVAGQLAVQSSQGNRTVTINGDQGTISITMPKPSGILSQTVFVNGQTARLQLGGMAASGSIDLIKSGGQAAVRLNAATADIQLVKPGGQTSMRISADSGDIQIMNADCAEDFDIHSEDEIEPGTVMVLDEEGALRASNIEYDRCVAGVISGAGEFKPGIVLHRVASERRRLPVALVGKVFCKVDATFGEIRVGDMLTTSPTIGHAMRASDPARAFGAVIGKALRAIRGERGLIPILVALQ